MVLLGPISYTSSYGSPLSQTIAPLWGSDPHGAGPIPAHSLHFPPSLCPTELCMDLYILFQRPGSPCLVSASVLQDLLHLKMYSWCICGERYSHPPTPLPSSAILFSHVPIHALNRRQTACHGNKQVQAR